MNDKHKENPQYAEHCLSIVNSRGSPYVGRLR